MSTDDRSAVLAIRLWLEAGLDGQESLRARITRKLDTEAPPSVETAAGPEAEIVDSVRSWVRTVLAGQ